jgi:ParB family chromosome partitioning protein
MSKLDDLRRIAGGNVTESSSRREAPAIAPATLATLNPARMEGVARSKAALEIPLGKIVRDPDQPREDFDDESIARLAASLKARGQLQPIRVRWDEGQGTYVLIAGERRWRAAAVAGLATMTCIVVDGEMTAAERLAAQVEENLQREDLRPIERAKAFRTLMDLNGWSGNQLAKELSISQSAVVQALALLDLPEPVQAAVEQGTLPPATAYELSKLDDAQAVAEVAGQVVAEGLTRAEAVAAVRERSARKSKGPKSRKVTTRTIRTGAGVKLTAECRRGLDPEILEAALVEALARVRSEMGGAAEQAAA